THIQFTGYKGDAWSTIESAGEDIVRELDNNPNVSIDLGQVVFGATTTMTADAPFEFILYHLRMWKAIFHDIEVETATGIVPYPYRRRSLVNTVQWAIGLEVALMSRSIWRIVLSTDHPNAAPFTMYPRIIKWLMSKKARDEELKRCNQRALRRINIHSIDREYSLYDIAIITRAAPAKILGLDKFKGHLGLNADADIAIYDIDPRNFEPSRDYDKIEKAFSRTYCTIKSGEIVVMSGEVVHTPYDQER
ncbi:MAG: formylmethanofuran dehydrogenase subunit A, partial [Thermoprotei archaeon ex4572_64]